MSQIPSFLTTSGLSIGRDKNYLYIDQSTNELKLGPAGVVDPASLTQIKEKIEAYIANNSKLNSHGSFIANIGKINAKIRKHNTNFQSTCCGGILSFFGIGVIREINIQQKNERSPLIPSSAARTYAVPERNFEEESPFVIKVTYHNSSDSEPQANYLKKQLLRASTTMVWGDPNGTVSLSSLGLTGGAESMRISYNREENCFTAAATTALGPRYRLNNQDLPRPTPDEEYKSPHLQLQNGENTFHYDGKPCFTVNVQKKPG